jgi:hypothetical protein
MDLHTMGERLHEARFVQAKAPQARVGSSCQQVRFGTTTYLESHQTEQLRLPRAIFQDWKEIASNVLALQQSARIEVRNQASYLWLQRRFRTLTPRFRSCREWIKIELA